MAAISEATPTTRSCPTVLRLLKTTQARMLVHMKRYRAPWPGSKLAGKPSRLRGLCPRACQGPGGRQEPATVCVEPLEASSWIEPGKREAGLCCYYGSILLCY